MDETREPRQRDQRGRLLPGNATDYSRYAMGDRDPAARAAKTADQQRRRAAARQAAGTAPAGEPLDVRLNVTLGPHDKPVAVRLTHGEAGHLDGQPGSRAGYVRDLLRRDHGITDTAGLDAKRAGATRSEYIRAALQADLGGETPMTAARERTAAMSKNARFSGTPSPFDDRPHVIDLTSDPLHVANGTTLDEVDFWSEHDMDAPEYPAAFQVVGTGQPLPDGALYVGTAPRTRRGSCGTCTGCLCSARRELAHHLGGDDAAELAPVRLKFPPVTVTEALRLEFPLPLRGDSSPHRLLGVHLVHHLRRLLVPAEQPGLLVADQHQGFHGLDHQALVRDRLAVTVDGGPAVRRHHAPRVVDQLDCFPLGELQDAGDLGAALILPQLGVVLGDDLGDPGTADRLHLRYLGVREPVTAQQAYAPITLGEGGVLRTCHTILGRLGGLGCCVPVQGNKRSRHPLASACAPVGETAGDSVRACGHLGGLAGLVFLLLDRLVSPGLITDVETEQDGKHEQGDEKQAEGPSRHAGRADQQGTGR